MLDPSAALTLHLIEVVIRRAKASYLPFRCLRVICLLKYSLEGQCCKPFITLRPKINSCFYPTFNHLLLIVRVPILLHEEK